MPVSLSQNLLNSVVSVTRNAIETGVKEPMVYQPGKRANLLFSERTIIRAMQRLAVERPELRELYPGLNNSPQHVRDLRRPRRFNY